MNAFENLTREVQRDSLVSGPSVIEPPGRATEAAVPAPTARLSSIRVTLLTGGHDKSYAVGLTTALASLGIGVDYIGSDRVDAPELHQDTLIKFLNLRGDQREDVSFWVKLFRILRYYARLLKYAACARPPVFHILWNNKFEWFDRVVLMLYYRVLNKRIVLTAHNVNAAKRDGHDNALNRVTLRIQYGLAHHLFVHTPKMKTELTQEFGVPDRKVCIIPFGMNDTTPVTKLSGVEARQILGLHSHQQVALFFGQIAPYKGLEHLLAALPEVIRQHPDFRLIIAGKVKEGCRTYWGSLQRQMDNPAIRNQVVPRIEHIPDDQVEVYFKAADCLVLPYVNIFQSGVPFLGYSFGLPVVATDVGSLREDVLEGRTGFVCKPQDPADLARALCVYFTSDLYLELASRRSEIRKLAEARHSWTNVANVTRRVYERLVALRRP